MNDREMLKKTKEFSHKIIEALDMDEFEWHQRDEVEARINACAHIMVGLIAGAATGGTLPADQVLTKNMIEAMVDAAVHEYRGAHKQCHEATAMHRLSGAMLKCLRDAAMGKIDPCELDEQCETNLDKLTEPLVQANYFMHSPSEVRSAVEKTKAFYRAGVEVIKGCANEKRPQAEDN